MFFTGKKPFYITTQTYVNVGIEVVKNSNVLLSDPETCYNIGVANIFR